MILHLDTDLIQSKINGWITETDPVYFDCPPKAYHHYEPDAQSVSSLLYVDYLTLEYYSTEHIAEVIVRDFVGRHAFGLQQYLMGLAQDQDSSKSKYLRFDQAAFAEGEIAHLDAWRSTSADAIELRLTSRYCDWTPSPWMLEALMEQYCPKDVAILLDSQSIKQWVEDQSRQAREYNARKSSGAK